MNPIASLQKRLASLEAEAAALKAEGDYYQNCWIQHSAAGGTATGRGLELGRYAVLRSRKTTFSNGRKSRYIPLTQVAEVAAAVERGQRLTKLEKSIAHISQMIDRLVVRANL